MSKKITVQRAQQADIPNLASIADVSLFPGDMLGTMIAPFLDGQDGVLWLTAWQGTNLIGFAFAVAEEMTDRTWNIKAIAVAENARRLGAGRALLMQAEADLDARVIVIDTTQLDDQDAGRKLYAACGYTQCSVIPGFWGPGEDKVTFSKALL